MDTRVKPAYDELAKSRRVVQRHPRLDDLVGVLHRLAALDLVDVLPAGVDLAPDRVLLGEEGGVVEADEELAAAGIRTCRARHRGGAAHMRLVVEFGLELLAGAAGAGALRTAGLRHETVDHAMEHDAVVKPLAHQLLDPGNVAGGKVGPHLDGDRPLRGFQDQSIFGVSHALFSAGLGEGFLLWNWTANGRPATAPAILSANWMGFRRCNAAITAIRYCTRSLSVACSDS